VVAVLSNSGIPLMPTNEYRARKLIKSGRAKIDQYRPFTIRLLDRKKGKTQPIEYASDTGYQTAGVSIKSEKHEYVHAEFTMLKDETERHNDRRKYRCARRSRLRYRKPRFSNRICTKKKGWLPPSLRHRMGNQLRIFDAYTRVMPITTATFEMGKFDTQLLKALSDGTKIPRGKDYQQGEKYLQETVRKAVFGRDGYTCQICGRSVKDGVILHEHHIGFWKGYRSDRIGNLLTVCEHCHTSKNHKPGGALWGIEPKSNMAPAAYMNAVRWQMYDMLRFSHPDVDIHIQYGARTSVTRKQLNIEKAHANDAYCIGKLRPKHRCRPTAFVKKRRNSRILSRFHDAKYVDLRDGSKKSGAQLSCGRTNRRESRRSDKNERIYRGQKVSKGRVSTRRKHYALRPGDVVKYEGGTYLVKGVQNCGRYVGLQGRTPVNIKKVISIKKTGGWQNIS
jgi:hypothetical protein